MADGPRLCFHAPNSVNIHDLPSLQTDTSRASLRTKINTTIGRLQMRTGKPSVATLLVGLAWVETSLYRRRRSVGCPFGLDRSQRP